MCNSLTHCGVTTYRGLAWTYYHTALPHYRGLRKEEYTYLHHIMPLSLSMLVLFLFLIASFSARLFLQNGQVTTISGYHLTRSATVRKKKGTLFSICFSKVHCSLSLNWGDKLIYKLELGRWNKPIVRLGTGHWIGLARQHCQGLGEGTFSKGKAMAFGQNKKEIEKHILKQNP